MSGDIKEVKCFNIKSNKEKVIMQKVKLNNGIEMPILGRRISDRRSSLV